MRERLEHWWEDYNRIGPRSALADRTSAEVAAAWMAGALGPPGLDPRRPDLRTLVEALGRVIFTPNVRRRCGSSTVASGKDEDLMGRARGKCNGTPRARYIARQGRQQKYAQLHTQQFR